MLFNLRLKITYIVLLLALLLSLTACSSFNDENVDIQDPVLIETTTGETEETIVATEMDMSVDTEPTVVETNPTVVTTKPTAVATNAIVTRGPTVTECSHKYRSTTFAPTCTEAGYTSWACSLCGDSYTESMEKATGHKWGDWETVKEATTKAEGIKQRVCQECDKVDSCKIDKLPQESKPAYEKFTGSIGEYNAHNLAYEDWQGCTEQAAFIEVYTAEKSDMVLQNLAKEFEKVHGFAPGLDDKYRASSSCEILGVYEVDGYEEPQTVYHYTITDKTYIYITNDMYKVYVQECDDGSVWIGYCLYGTMDTVAQERSKVLDEEMYSTFAQLIGVSKDKMYDYEEQLQLKIGLISAAGTVRSIHSDGLVDVLYIYCRGFPIDK